MLLLLAPGCCAPPRGDGAGPAPSSSAAPADSDDWSNAREVNEPPSVELSRDRGTYKGHAQARVDELARRVQQVEGKVAGRPDQAQALRDAHWELIRAFKGVETSDEESFPAARERFEQADKKLAAKLNDAAKLALHPRGSSVSASDEASGSSCVGAGTLSRSRTSASNSGRSSPHASCGASGRASS